MPRGELGERFAELLSDETALQHKIEEQVGLSEAYAFELEEALRALVSAINIFMLLTPTSTCKHQKAELFSKGRGSG